MLGAEQEGWLYDGLVASAARWNILGSNVMVGRLDHDGADGDRRGYVRCRVGRSQLEADLQVVSTVSRPDAPESTFASFVIQDGQPGAQVV
jgi:phosphodiesterase/alkaline phosphatase D-like protein